MIDEIKDKWKNIEIPEKDRKRYLRTLEIISKKDIHKKQKLVGSRRPLEDLSVSAFMRWIYAHRLLNSDRYIDRLLKEIKINPEFKITKRLISTTKQFPTRSKIEYSVTKFLKSEQNIFSHQEAECLRAIRYVCNIHDEILNHSRERLLDPKQDPYLRMQSAYLLSRNEMNIDFLLELENLIEVENDAYVQVAISTILVQKRHKNEELIRKLVFHPNEKVSDVGKLYRYTKTSESFAYRRLDYIFKSGYHWLLCDNVQFLYLMSYSDNKNIKERLINMIREPREKHPVTGLRKTLKEIFARTRESLRN